MCATVNDVVLHGNYITRVWKLKGALGRFLRNSCDMSCVEGHYFMYKKYLNVLVLSYW